MRGGSELDLPQFDCVRASDARKAIFLKSRVDLQNIEVKLYNVRAKKWLVK